jgi:hypothetical protein
MARTFLEHLARLRPDVAGAHHVAVEVDGELAGDIEGLADPHAVRERPPGRDDLGAGDDLTGHGPASGRSQKPKSRGMARGIAGHMAVSSVTPSTAATKTQTSRLASSIGHFTMEDTT